MAGTLLSTCAFAAVAAKTDADTLHKSLVKQLEAQNDRIRELEVMISKLGKGTCAPARGGTVDLEPELRAFRLEEAQRAATRRQEQLETLFSISVGEPLTAVAISAGLANKGVPKLMIGAGASGSLFLFDQNGTLALTHP